GHAAFFGIGAYTAGLLAKGGWGEPVSGLLAAAAVAGLAGYVGSFIVSRVRHLALIMVTLGLGLLVHAIANKAHWLTGGGDGRPHHAPPRPFPCRPLRLPRLPLPPDRPRHGLSGGAPHRQFPIRPLVAGTPRESGADARARRAEPRAHPHGLHLRRRPRGPGR